jgi:hypothetical protein
LHFELLDLLIFDPKLRLLGHANKQTSTMHSHGQTNVLPIPARAIKKTAQPPYLSLVNLVISHRVCRKIIVALWVTV